MTNPKPPGYLDDGERGRITVTTTEAENSPAPKTESVVSMSAFVTTPTASEGGTLVADEPDKPSNELSTWRTRIIIITLSGITLTTSMSVGAFTIALPAMAKDMKLTAQFLLWPQSMYSLTNGCFLFLAGSIADHIGNRNMNIFGCFFAGSFVLAGGLSQTGVQLTVFRGLQGIGAAMCLPTAFSIISKTIPTGRQRNIAFACLGLGQPLGWFLGLLVGGICEGSQPGWRLAIYITAVLTILLGLINIWSLPNDRRTESTWSSFYHSVDWIGLSISSTCFGTLSYVFAVISGDLKAIEQTVNIALLCLAAVLMPMFAFWMNLQEKHGRPALVPNSMWRNKAFTCMCIMVVLIWATLQCMRLFLSLFFQNIQHFSALNTAVLLLPNVIAGITINLLTGFLACRVSSYYLVLTANVFGILAPLLLCVINPDWNYWICSFWAVLLSPVAAGVVFTIANLVITDAFPKETQALAGAMSNTAQQLGGAFGLALAGVVSARGSQEGPKGSQEALWLGYRAVFYMCFGAMVVACLLGAVALRGVGVVGTSNEKDRPAAAKQEGAV
ncbi:hypothetical protein V493_06667 [Pseudogymnoascus sp. VKM F-4281 (FW-2241)]|nr:hypothetical protein V493_06667 [Pseudogymnoascus sp. VKM F-4281 (FW-2241)]